MLIKEFLEKKINLISILGKELYQVKKGNTYLRFFFFFLIEIFTFSMPQKILMKVYGKAKPIFLYSYLTYLFI